MLKEKIECYKKVAKDLANEVISSADFKKQSSVIGIYEQKTPNTFMVRVRIPGGIITLKNIKTILNIADNYADGYIHFTTRQDIQFHNVNIENTCKILDELHLNSLITYGSGGNAARNIACSAMSGFGANDIFDVTEYAQKVSEYIAKDQSYCNLPRKYKIAFSSTHIDSANARISDLGFIAKIQNNQKGFELYGAGGLGNTSCVSMKLSDFINANDVLYHVEAMKQLFEKEGDRTNRNKARIRFIRYRLGDENFKEKYFEFVEKVKKESNLDLNTSSNVNNNFKTENCNNKNTRLIKQNNENYAILIHPQGGTVSTKEMYNVTKFLENKNLISIRLTNEQSFIVRNLSLNDAESLLKLTSNFASDYDINNSISCISASICKTGLCKSQELLNTIIKRFEKEPVKIKSILPQLYISGCKNSCSQHQKALIGFAGKFVKTDDGIKNAYTLFLGGNTTDENAHLAKEYGCILAEDIPDLLYEIAQNACKFNNIHNCLEDKNLISAIINKYNNEP